jgi:hypothetical protein
MFADLRRAIPTQVRDMRAQVLRHAEFRCADRAIPRADASCFQRCEQLTDVDALVPDGDEVPSRHATESNGVAQARTGRLPATASAWRT